MLKRCASSKVGITTRWSAISAIGLRVVQSSTAYYHTLRSFSRDARLYLVTVTLFGFAVFGGIYTTLLNLYLLRLGYGPETAGLVNGVGQLVLAVCALPTGVLGRAWGSRRMLIMGFSLMALGFGLLPLAEFSPGGQLVWLIAAQTTGQVGIAIYFVNGGPFVMTVTSPAERNHVFAAFAALLPLSGFLGSLVGGFLPGLFAGLLGMSLDAPGPYRLSLLLVGVLMFPAVMAMVSTRTRDVPPAKQPVEPRQKSAPIIMFVVLFLTVFFRVVGEGVIRTFLNIYLDDSLHMPVAQIGLLLAIGQLLAVPTAMFMPLVVNRWGIRDTYVYSTLATAFCFVPMAFVPHWSGAAVGYIGILGLLSLSRPAIVAFQMESVPAGWRTMMSGTTTTAVGLGWAAASLAGGFLIVGLGYASLFLAGGIMTVMAAAVFWGYFRKSI